MPAALRERNFAFFWVGNLISATGDWMLLVGLPIYIFTLTHSILATSATFLAAQIPQILLGSVAGVLVDRWNRQRVIVITNVSLAVGLLPLLFIHSSTQVWIVYGVAAIESSLAQFLSAESALLPRLVGEEHLAEANSLGAFSTNAARLIGPAIGGLVTALFSLPGVALLDALTFLIAAVLTAGIAVDARPSRSLVSSEELTNQWVKVWKEWLEGLRLIPQQHIILGFFIVMSIAAFADGLFIVLFAPFVKTILHGGALELGYLTSAQAAGGLIGGLFMLRIAKQSSPAKLIGLCGLADGALCLVLFNYPSVDFGIVPAVTCFMLIGVANIGFFVQLTTLLQTQTPDAYRGRIFGAYGMIWALFLLLGTTLTGVVGDHISIILLLNTEAILFFPAAIVAFLFFRSPAAPPAPEPDQQSDEVTMFLP
jgi:MFS family permease